VGSAHNLPHLSASEAAFVVEGGANRQESSRIGTEAADADIVLIHDAARPFLSAEVIGGVIEGVYRTGAAAAAVPVSDTLRETTEGGYRLVDRERAWAMQTPQGGRRELLLEAHSLATAVHTDEMAILEAAGFPVEIVQGSSDNFKVTTAADMSRAQAMIGGVETRTGLGYDIHAFSSDPSRPLFLGGVLFEGTGLEGHSDADVLIHAVVDALLGAACLGDIGQHFPNTDAQWGGAPSSIFLESAAALVRREGWRIVHVDVAVIAQLPKIMPRAEEIRTVLAGILGVGVDRVSLKATTNEGLDALGRGEGVAAYATATLAR
jgi:2-C-methyl-D-erythritol 4-phosphate cytidylyltransferase/2-C-methyl-D-erythritol 2,4-cyclodiphosphate synthase